MLIYKASQSPRQAPRKNKLSARRLSYKKQGLPARFIEGELAILNAIGRLNRAIAAHEDYLADCEHYGSGDDNWTPAVRLPDNYVIAETVQYCRPAHYLLLFTVKEIRALRDALNACPLAALRFRVSVRQVRQRWLRHFNRELPITATRPADVALAEI